MDNRLHIHNLIKDEQTGQLCTASTGFFMHSVSLFRSFLDSDAVKYMIHLNPVISQVYDRDKKKS